MKEMHSLFTRLRMRFKGFMRRLGISAKHANYLEKWAILSVAVGVIGGLGGVVFDLLLEGCRHLFLDQGLEFLGYLGPWRLPLIVGIGGLISGFIVASTAPEAKGHGTDAAIKAFHKRWGSIRARIPVVKIIASAITIGSGGSAGREGPIAQTGAGFGSTLAGLLRLNVRDRKTLLIAGIAAGIGSVFKSPLGGSIFAIEVLYRRDFEVEGFIPSVIASVSGYAVSMIFTGVKRAFEVPPVTLTNPLELILYGFLGLICGVSAMIFVKVFYLTELLFERLKVPEAVKPAIGGALTGLIGLIVPDVLGGGYGVIQRAINGEFTTEELTFLGIAKIAATSFTVASGGSGGVFAPSVFVGAMIGGALNLFLKTLPLTFIGHIAPYVLVGMASFFAAASKAPLASVILVVEMSGGYQLLAPSLIACTIAYIISGDVTIYGSQLERR